MIPVALLIAFAASASAQPIVTGSVPLRLRAVAVACEAQDIDALAIALSDPEPAVRRRVVSCWPDEAERDGLESALSDGDESVRRALARRLPFHGLTDPLLRDRAGSVRSARLSAISPESPDCGSASAAAVLDTDPFVALAGAAALSRCEVRPELSPEQQRRFDRLSPLLDLELDHPERVAAILTTRTRAEQATDWYAIRADDAGGCLSRARRTSASLRDEAYATTQLSDLASIDVRLLGTRSNYESCLLAEPLQPGTDGLTLRSLRARAETSTRWMTNYGLLRPDVEVVPDDAGELRARAELQVNGYAPFRATGDPPPDTVVSGAFAGRIRYDQFFRHDHLTGLNGGGFARLHLPFNCRGGRCLASVTGFGDHDSADDDAFPESLVAERDRFGGSADLHWPWDGFTVDLGARYERLAYTNAALHGADWDSGRVHLTVDSPFQLRLEAARTDFIEPATASGLPTRRGAIDWDSTTLGGLAGVRFGSDDGGESLQLIVLGGAVVPLLDDVEPTPDPQVVFDLLLQLEYRGYSGPSVRLGIGGGRSVTASPRDFALQAVVESAVEFLIGVVRPHQFGVESELAVRFQMVDHLSPITRVDDLRLNLIEGEIGVRFFFEEWFGIELSDTILAMNVDQGDFTLSNRLLFSLFVPMGGYAFDAEEPWP